jgi:hypothetical protein
MASDHFPVIVDIEPRHCPGARRPPAATWGNAGRDLTEGTFMML